ncbi:unnamed protein product, partial [Vitis vinifera]
MLTFHLPFQHISLSLSLSFSTLSNPCSCKISVVDHQMGKVLCVSWKFSWGNSWIRTFLGFWISLDCAICIRGLEPSVRRWIIQV